MKNIGLALIAILLASPALAQGIAGGGGNANPTATAGPVAVNGSASTRMRSDGAPAVQKGSNAQFGLVEGDGQSLTCVVGVCSTLANTRTAATPTVTTADMGGTLWISSGGLTIPVISTGLFDNKQTLLVVNYAGSASTVTNSSGQTINSGGGCSTTIPAGGFWQLQPNGTSIDCAQGISVGSAASSIVPGTTTITGATAPCVVENSTSTTMACTAETGTGSFVRATSATLVTPSLGTPSALVLTNATGLPAAQVPATPTTAGTNVTLTGPRAYYTCTGTCTITLPVPVAGYEFCVRNSNNVSTVITLAALGSSARYEATARTSYGTAGTGTFVSGGAVTDQVCLVGLDSTHYLTMSSTGTWTAS